VLARIGLELPTEAQWGVCGTRWHAHDRGSTGE
jgi:hypothetical protein